jgi:DNA-directed RNA polymerase delta subunit
METLFSSGICISSHKWQFLGLEEQGPFRSSQSLSKLLTMSKQQLSHKKLHIELFWQEFKKDLALFSLGNACWHLKSVKN